MYEIYVIVHEICVKMQYIPFPQYAIKHAICNYMWLNLN